MTASPTVVVTECDHDAFTEEQDVAERNGLTLRVEQSTPDDLVERCRDADGILVQYATIDGAVMDALPRLRVIGRYGVGVDSVDVAAATERGIAVCNVPDYGTEAVSDHAITLALATARAIPRLDREVRAGTFDLPAVRPMYTFASRTFGVVGLGRIGAATARKAAGLGYEVIGWDVLAEPGQTRHGIAVVALTELLRRSHVVSLHVPLDEANHHLIGPAELELMRSDAVLINTARGGIIDTDALVAALRTGALGGAGLDCHEVEPLPVDHPLTQLDNVVLTPHLAWYTEESYGLLKRRTMENVAAVLLGREPRTIINPEVLAAPRHIVSEEAVR